MFAPLPRVVLVSNGARASDQDMGEVRERHRDEHRTRQRSRVDPRGLFRSGFRGRGACCLGESRAGGVRGELLAGEIIVHKQIAAPRTNPLTLSEDGAGTTKLG